MLAEILARHSLGFPLEGQKARSFLSQVEIVLEACHVLIPIPVKNIEASYWSALDILHAKAKRVD